MISSSPGRVIALDLHEYLKAIACLQGALGCNLDDCEIFDFVLSSLTIEDTAMEDLNMNLLTIRLMENDHRTMAWSPETDAKTSDELLDFCLEYGKHLFQQLQDAGAYVDGRLNYAYVGNLVSRTAFLKEKETEDVGLAYPAI